MNADALLKKAAIGFKRQAFNRKNLRYLLYYAAANFQILTLFAMYQSIQGISLELKPVTSPATEGSSLLFVAAVILLPLSLLLEELGFRLLPMFFIRDVFHLNRLEIGIEEIVEKKKGVFIWDDAGLYIDSKHLQKSEIKIIAQSPARLWICHHWVWIFIVVSALWAGMLHQVNVVSSDALGAWIYFGVQTFSGFCFAWIYARRGLGASWAVHTAWDLFIVALNLIILL
jgi:membrane protease YdiL (CAAX protease family)